MSNHSDWELSFISCKYSEKLLDKITHLNQTAQSHVNILDVKKAIHYAKLYHGSQVRQSGEPYYSHPIEVAYMVCDYLFETDAIITSLLHDTLEDTALTYEMIAADFNSKIAEHVKDLTRITPSGKISSAEMVKQLWIEKKYKLILIKLFDRLHNMQTIFAKSPEKQQKIVTETLQYFLALSEILEIPALSEILYTTCYKANKRLGLVEEMELELDKEIKFVDALVSGNNSH
jgi:guanosine-3',5'-bis(diphosphate) 3'-pyrophosphohydrolase